jgi:hypothetical protein
MRPFEIFCSYAHADNDHGWVDKFVEDLASICWKLVGERCAIFLDRETLLTAQIWEEKIKGALESSGVMIAISSPSYARSEWCTREWQLFSEREAPMRKLGLLAEDEGLIFPILLYPFDRGRFDIEQQAFVDKIKKRQWLDISSQLPDTPVRPRQLRQLAESIIDLLIRIETKRKFAERELSIQSLGIIVDSESGLMWSTSLSPAELTYTDAKKYVGELVIDGISDWRLPLNEELETLIIKGQQNIHPLKQTFSVLRDPFNAQHHDYLHSGTISDDHSNYIMNVRTGNIFSGEDKKAHVRAVRGQIIPQSSAIYVLFRNAILLEQQVTCSYGGRQRELSPRIIGTDKNGEEVLLAWQFGGEGNGKLPQWRCLKLANVKDARVRNNPRYKVELPHTSQTCVVDIDIDINIHVLNRR